MAARLFAVPDPTGADNRAVQQGTGAGTDAVMPLQSPYRTYLDRLAPATRNSVVCRLDVIASMLWPGVPASSAPWHELDAGALMNLRARLAERYRFDNAANYLAAAKGALRAAWLLGLVSSDVWTRAREVEAPKGNALPAGHWIGDDEWARLFASIAEDESAAGVRDLAIFAVLRGSGCRRHELTALDLDDWNHAAAVLRFRTAKGNRQRESAVPAWVRGPMAAYLRVRGPMPGPLFVRLSRNSYLEVDVRLSTRGLHHLFKSRCEAVGLGHLTPHDARRGYVSSALEAGIDPVAIARQVGHAQVQTTMRYDRRPLAQLQDMAQRMPNPFDGGEGVQG
jgi:integrase/recombinase XerD